MACRTGSKDGCAG